MFNIYQFASLIFGFEKKLFLPIFIHIGKHQTIFSIVISILSPENFSNQFDNNNGSNHELKPCKNNTQISCWEVYINIIRGKALSRN